MKKYTLDKLIFTISLVAAGTGYGTVAYNVVQAGDRTYMQTYHISQEQATLLAGKRAAERRSFSTEITENINKK